MSRMVIVVPLIFVFSIGLGVGLFFYSQGGMNGGGADTPEKSPTSKASTPGSDSSGKSRIDSASQESTKSGKIDLNTPDGKSVANSTIRPATAGPKIKSGSGTQSTKGIPNSLIKGATVTLPNGKVVSVTEAIALEKAGKIGSASGSSSLKPVTTVNPQGTRINTEGTPVNIYGTPVNAQGTPVDSNGTPLPTPSPDGTQGPYTTPTPAADAKTGSVFGLVYDIQNNQPLPGAMVSAESSRAGSNDFFGLGLATVQTGPDGHFSIDNLPADPPYDITVKMTGFADTRRQGIYVSTNEIQLPLYKGCPVEGTVTNSADGQPAPGATVKAYQRSQVVAEVKANETGVYRFESLAPGTYVLVASTNDQISLDQTQQGKTVEIKAGQTEPIRVDLVVHAAGGLKGIVVDAATDAGLSGADVRLYWQPYETQNWQFYRSTTSGADGTFEFLGLPDGTYYLSARKPPTYGEYLYSDHYTIGNAEIIPEIKLPLSSSTGSISGRVTLDGFNPAAGVRVEVQGSQCSAMTNDNGEFNVEGIGASLSPCTLIFTLSGYVTIMIPGVEVGTKDLAVTMGPGGKVRGRVVSRDTGQGIAGARLTLTLRVSAGGGRDVQETESNMNGDFQFSAVPMRSPYTIVVDCPGYERQTKEGEVTSEEDAIVEFQLEGGFKLVGTVLEEESQQPAPEVKVSVNNDKSNISNTDGQFEISGLPRGRITVYVTSNRYGSNFRVDGEVDYRQYYIMEMEQPETPITIFVRAGVTLKGMVTRAKDGQPIPGAMVSELSTKKMVRTGSDGKYILPGLPPDTGLSLVVAADGYEQKEMNPERFKFPPGEYEKNWVLGVGGRIQGHVIPTLSVQEDIRGTMGYRIFDPQNDARPEDIIVSADCIRPDDPDQLPGKQKDVPPRYTDGIYTLDYLRPGMYRVLVIARKLNPPGADEILAESESFPLAYEQQMQVPDLQIQR